MAARRRRGLALAACRVGAVAAAVVVAAVGPARAADAAAPLTVCMAENNAPLSYRAGGGEASGAEMRGLDVHLSKALAAQLGRPLKIVPFESKYEADSTLTHEVNALLSSGVCDLASGFALLASDLGTPSRPTARVPDYPGAPRPPQRPWVPLGMLAPSHAYHAMAMGLVVRDASRASATLAEPGDARIGVVGGTLAGTAVSMFRSGKLRPQLVSLSQTQDALAELDAGHIDATLAPLARLDAWRIAHPATTLQRTVYVHPLRINVGFVGLAGAGSILAAADRLIDASVANGDLMRWYAESGATFIAPAEPQVSANIGIAELLRE